MPVDLVRDAAIDVLLRVFERGVHLDDSLDKTLRRKEMSERGRRFLTHLVYGTVRHTLLCDHVLRRACTQPLEKLPPPIHAILRMAVYQALFSDQVTTPAMVHTSVELAKRRGHAGLARMVNAVLRKVPAKLELVPLPDPAKNLARYLSVRHSMPQWLVEDWLGEHGEAETQRLCEVSNTQAPTVLRINRLKTDAAQLAKDLTAAGIVTAKTTELEDELTVLQGDGLFRCKRFQQGHFIVQDPASMLPPLLLEPQPGERVLDLCSAPGGKTTYLAERAAGRACIVAHDTSLKRIRRVWENVGRLETPNVHLCVGDGVKPPFAPIFDRVLVDAPCSGLGTLRRHPDIKLRMTRDTIERLVAQQIGLLRSAVRLCKNNGVIVYSVCTFSVPETCGVVQALLDDGGIGLENGPETLNAWQIAQGQYATRPGEAWDGFFLTRFRKLS